ncbi:MAG: hypothetical protein PVJ67_01460 [Candidatus Pacearchaeota archaeon]|jgi:hypothetical protein
MWTLDSNNGIDYNDVIEKYPKKYELRGGHVWSKELKPWQKIAESKGISGRPFSHTSIIIKYDLEDTSPENLKKLKKQIELANILDENNCDDYLEIPSRKSLEIISRRFSYR